MDTNAYRTRLVEELATLEKELATLGRLDPDNKVDWVPAPDSMDTDSADRNEVADSIESLEENTAVLADLEIRYNSVKSALARIDKGTYGTCVVCGKPIEGDRLNASPAAATCKAHMNASR